MADDSEFIARLISFGLSEKEAQVYFHLLKYGPKPPTLLAKSLKTYREDVHRTLSGLIDKGMVNPSLEAPTVYAAVELDIALDAALKKHESEHREMEMRKGELQAVSQQLRFRPSDEFATFKIIKSLKELIAIAMTALNSSEKEWPMVCPPIFSVVGSLYALEDTIKFIDRGGGGENYNWCLVPIYRIGATTRAIGVDGRHFDQYRGIMFAVFDRKTCGSAINFDFTRVSLNTPISMFWTDDLTYANYLVSTFELLWEQAIPVAQRIEELLKEGSPQAWWMVTQFHSATLMTMR